MRQYEEWIWRGKVSLFIYTVTQKLTEESISQRYCCTIPLNYFCWDYEILCLNVVIWELPRLPCCCCPTFIWRTCPPCCWDINHTVYCPHNKSPPVSEESMFMGKCCFFCLCLNGYSSRFTRLCFVSVTGHSSFWQEVTVLEPNPNPPEITGKCQWTYYLLPLLSLSSVCVAVLISWLILCLLLGSWYSKWLLLGWWSDEEKEEEVMRKETWYQIKPNYVERNAYSLFSLPPSLSLQLRHFSRMLAVAQPIAWGYLFMCNLLEGWPLSPFSKKPFTILFMSTCLIQTAAHSYGTRAEAFTKCEHSYVNAIQRGDAILADVLEMKLRAKEGVVLDNPHEIPHWWMDQHTIRCRLLNPAANSGVKKNPQTKQMFMLQSSAETDLWGFSTSCWGSQCSKTNDREDEGGEERGMKREGERREEGALKKTNEAGMLFRGQWVGRLLI